MPRFDYKHCRRCGNHVDICGTVSRNRLCARCGSEALTSNVHQMMARSGPNWTRWRQSMAACVGGALLDDKRPSP